MEVSLTPAGKFHLLRYSGYNSVDEVRNEFPITGGQYQIDVGKHSLSTVSIVLSRDGQDFESPPVQEYTVTGQGTICAELQGLSDYSAGDNVTMQVIFKANDESTNFVSLYHARAICDLTNMVYQYACADLQLTDTSLDDIDECCRLPCSTGSGITVSDLDADSNTWSITDTTSNENATILKSPSSSSSFKTNGAETSAGGPSMRENVVFGLVVSFGLFYM